MRKAIKTIISSIIIMLVLIGISTTSNAYYVGQKGIHISYNEYKKSGNIFCVEHFQNQPKNRIEYTVVSNVTIKGLTSTDHNGKTIKNTSNARMAYILSHGTKRHKQVALWNFIYYWMRDVGRHHDGLYLGFVNYKPTEEKDGGILKSSITYANKLAEDTTPKDYTNKDKIKMVQTEKDNIKYIRVGPFNWKFKGTLTTLSVKDENGKSVSNVLYSIFKGNTEQYISIGKIESGKNFYISIPMNSGIKKITQVDGKSQISVLGVNLWFLKSNQKDWQNLLIPEPTVDKEDIDLHFKYDIQLLGDLEVIKVDEKDNKIKLPNVQFRIKNSKGQYVKAEFEQRDARIGNFGFRRGEAKAKEYTNIENNATIFITDKDGKVTIKDLVVGTYTVEEIKNPNFVKKYNF